MRRGLNHHNGCIKAMDDPLWVSANGCSYNIFRCEMEYVAATNQAPTDIALSGTTLNDYDVIGTAVGTLTTTDPDFGDRFTYSLTSNPSSYFSISADQLLTAALSIPQGTHSVTVRVTDSGGKTFDKSFTLTCGHANRAPINIAMSSTSAENDVPADTIFAEASATDPDGDVVTFSMPVNGGGNFKVVGTAVKTKIASIPIGSYSITLRATDTHGAFNDQAFTITVAHTNHAPVDITLSGTNVVYDNVPAGTYIGDLSANDANLGDTFTYAITVNPSSYFQIQNVNKVYTLASIGTLVDGIYATTFQVTDSTGLTFSKSIPITVAYPYQAETLTLVAAMGVAPDATRQKLYDNLIATMKTKGVWSLLDLLYVCASHDTQASRLNWINPGTNTLTISGTPVFTTDRGWVGVGGAVSKLDTGFNPFTATKLMAQDNVSIGAYIQTNNTTAFTTVGTSGLSISARTNAKATMQCGSATACTYTATTTNYQGFFQARRVNSTQTAAWGNLGSTGLNTSCTSQASFPNSTLNVCGGGGPGTTTNGSPHQVRVFYCGKGLTDQNTIDLHDAIMTYLTAVGANLTTGVA